MARLLRKWNNVGIVLLYCATCGCGPMVQYNEESEAVSSSISGSALPLPDLGVAITMHKAPVSRKIFAEGYYRALEIAYDENTLWCPFPQAAPGMGTSAKVFHVAPYIYLLQDNSSYWPKEFILDLKEEKLIYKFSDLDTVFGYTVYNGMSSTLNDVLGENDLATITHGVMHAPGKERIVFIDGDKPPKLPEHLLGQGEYIGLLGERPNGAIPQAAAEGASPRINK